LDGTHLGKAVQQLKLESGKPTSDANDVFEGRDRKTGELKWTGTCVVDLGWRITRARPAK
jgi:catalase (peroxidase I)